MKKCLFLIQILFFNRAFAVTPSKLVDGKVVFAVGSVSGDYVWTTADFNAIAQSSAPGNLTAITPTILEVSISTGGLKFSNYSDFVKCVESNSYLDEKVLDLKPSELKAVNKNIKNMTTLPK